MHPAFRAVRVADAAPEFEFAHNFYRQFAALIGPFNGKAGAGAASHIHLIGPKGGKARQRQAAYGTDSGGALSGGRRRGGGGGFGRPGGAGRGSRPNRGAGSDPCRGPSGSAIALALSCLRLAGGPLLLLARLALLRLLLSSRALLLLCGGAWLTLGIALRRLGPGRRIDHRRALFWPLLRGGRGLAWRRHVWLRATQARLAKGW